METNLFVQELLGGVGVALCTPNECQAVVHEGLIRVLIENAEENGLCFVGVTAHDFDDVVEGLNRKTRWVEGLDSRTAASGSRDLSREEQAREKTAPGVLEVGVDVDDAAEGLAGLECTTDRRRMLAIRAL